ncbi:MAG: glycogen/starch synthase [Muribaculaceae bacterium]
MVQSPDKFDQLFEVSWEVCNKVGGIYTVLSTKAKTLQKLFKDKTIFIGPDVWSPENQSPYFIESKTLLKEWKESAIFPFGMTIRVGRWDIPGKPIVILVNYNSLLPFKNQLYAEMWDRFHVDSLHAYGDYDESCMFAYASALVIESYCLVNRNKSANVIAHFNEWTTGMGLLYLKAHTPCIATIFTTHATSIGRSICGNNKPLYDYLDVYNGDIMASQLNMQSKHSLEKAAAQNADCFTTVSDVTALECEHLLGRRPNIVTPNGFEQNFVPAKSKYDAQRSMARERLLKVASSLIGSKLDDNAFIIATSGRNEFRNKGLDIFIETLNKLRNINSTRQIIAFIMVPAWVEKPRADLQNAINSSHLIKLDNKTITHSLNDYSSDAIYNRLNYLGIHNAEHENVKVIYVPSYLNGDDGIFDMTYYDLIPGFDATAFPSYYEPWGYTPLESIAFGVPTISTGLSGFGQWILANFSNDFASCGVNVIHRSDCNYDQVIDDMVDDIKNLVETNDSAMAKIRLAAMKTASKADWKFFIESYIIAFDIALKNCKNCKNKS